MPAKAKAGRSAWDGKTPRTSRHHAHQKMSLPPESAGKEIRIASFFQGIAIKVLSSVSLNLPTRSGLKEKQVGTADPVNDIGAEIARSTRR